MSKALEKAGYYCSAGLSVIWLRRGEKAPVESDWAGKPAKSLSELTEVFKKGYNIGIRPGKFSVVDGRYLTIIDVDIKEVDKTDEAIENLTELFPYWQDLPRIASGSRNGSMHLWLLTDKPVNKQLLRRSEAKVKINGKVKDCWQIEIYGNGSQTAVPPSIHPDSKQEYVWEANEPDWLFGDWPEACFMNVSDLPNELKVAQRDALDLDALEDDDDADFAAFADTIHPLPDIGEEEARQILALIPNTDDDSVDYDTWFRVVAACAHQFDRNKVGLKLLMEWSSQSSAHDAATTKYKYETARRNNGDSASFHWLVKHTGWNKLKKKAEAKSVIDEVNELIDNAEDGYAIKDALKIISKHDDVTIDVVDRGLLADRAIAKYKALGETPPGKVDIKKLMKYVPQTTAERIDELSNSDEELPSWLNNVVYVSGEDAFYKATGKQVWDATAFNRVFGIEAKEYGINDRGLYLVSPTDLATQVFRVKQVDARRYVPGAKRIFQHEGLTYMNMYSKPKFKLTTKTYGVIEALDKHLEIFENPIHRLYIKDWMGHLVQSPHIKLDYAMLIKGVQGDGKSLLRYMMEVLCGIDNCSLVETDQMKSRFNDWIGNCVLCSFEEVKNHGVEQYDAINRMKSKITNPEVTVEGKGKDAKRGDNFANVLMLTNYEDAMPIDDKDSRYLVLFTRFESKEEHAEYRKKCKAEGSDHLHKLQQWFNPKFKFKNVAEREAVAAELYEYFKEYEFSEYYDPHSRAPKTEHRQRMIESSRNDHAATLSEAIADPKERLVNEDYIVYNNYVAYYSSQFDEGHSVNPQSNGFKYAIKDAGFVRAGRYRLDPKSAALTIYVKPKFMQGKVLDAEILHKIKADFRSDSATVFDDDDFMN